MTSGPPTFPSGGCAGRSRLRESPSPGTLPAGGGPGLTDSPPTLHCRVPFACLTATATPRVRDDVIVSLGLERPEVFVSSFNRPNLHYSTRFVDLGASRDPALELLAVLREQQPQQQPGEAGAAFPCCLVYVRARKVAEDVASNLRKAGIILCNRLLP